MLFADVATGDLFTVLTVLAAFGSSVLNFLQYRSKLQFDAESVKLRSDVAHLTSEVEECRVDRVALRERIEHLEKMLDDDDEDDDADTDIHIEG